MLFLPNENVLKFMWGENLLREGVADTERQLAAIAATFDPPSIGYRREWFEALGWMEEGDVTE